MVTFPDKHCDQNLRLQGNGGLRRRTHAGSKPTRGRRRMHSRTQGTHAQANAERFQACAQARAQTSSSHACTGAGRKISCLCAGARTHAGRGLRLGARHTYACAYKVSCPTTGKRAQARIFSCCPDPGKIHSFSLRPPCFLPSPESPGLPLRS